MNREAVRSDGIRGTLGETELLDEYCPRCGGQVIATEWISSCGAMKDEQHTCMNDCGFVRWLTDDPSGVEESEGRDG